MIDPVKVYEHLERIQKTLAAADINQSGLAFIVDSDTWNGICKYLDFNEDPNTVTSMIIRGFPVFVISP